jgi:hypothetical protein
MAKKPRKHLRREPTAENQKDFDEAELDRKKSGKTEPDEEDEDE